MQRDKEIPRDIVTERHILWYRKGERESEWHCSLMFFPVVLFFNVSFSVVCLPLNLFGYNVDLSFYTLMLVKEKKCFWLCNKNKSSVIFFSMSLSQNNKCKPPKNSFMLFIAQSTNIGHIRAMTKKKAKNKQKKNSLECDLNPWTFGPKLDAIPPHQRTS